MKYASLFRGMLMFLFFRCVTAYGGVFLPVYTAAPGERCLVAERLYTRADIRDKVTEADASELLSFARDSKDACLEMRALIYMVDFKDRGDFKNEDSVLRWYQDALEFARRGNFEKDAAILTFRTGLKHYSMEQYPRAFELLLKGYDDLKTVGFGKIPGIQEYLYRLGIICFEFGDNEKAMSYIAESQQFPFPDFRAAIHTYNTLGLISMSMNKPKDALSYYGKAMHVAKATNDSVWIGIISGNNAYVLINMGRKAEAKPLIMLDYDQSVKHQEWNSAANGLLLIVAMNLEEDSVKAAETLLRRITEMRVEGLSDGTLRDYYLYSSKIAYLHGNYKRAYEFQDSVNFYRSRLEHARDQEILRKGEIKASTDRYLNEIELLESNRQKDRFFRNFVITVAVSLVVIALLLVNYQLLRRRRDKALYQLEKHRAEEELKNAESSLQAYMNTVLEKNRLIERLREETVAKSADQDMVTVSSDGKEQLIDRLYEFTILTEDDWINFKRMFDKVHKGFFIRLKEKYPELTVAETRLIALTKLNLSVNEIANMLGISPDSVRKTANRLRKKLNLPSGNDVFNLAADV